MDIELHFIVKFVSLNRIFRVVEKEVNFVFNFISSARTSLKPYLDPGGGRSLPAKTLDVNNVFKIKANSTKLGDFS